MPWSEIKECVHDAISVSVCTIERIIWLKNASSNSDGKKVGPMICAMNWNWKDETHH